MPNKEFYFWTRKQTHNHLASRVGHLAKDPKRRTCVKSWSIFVGCNRSCAALRLAHLEPDWVGSAYGYLTKDSKAIGVLGHMKALTILFSR